MASSFRSVGWPGWLVGLACWVVLFALYEVLAANPTWTEAVAGGLGSLIATIAVLLSGSREHLGKMQPGWWLILLRRIPGQVVIDTVRVVGAAVTSAPPRGQLRAVPFDPGADDTLSATRRALVTAGASIAPNTYVVLIDSDHGRLLTHQLVPTEEPPGRGDPLWPI